ncbi:4'-phosphopantetheinyl transferase superfamily protein [Streptomyces sp. RerS4]|uniref:4'-phosphopantetheinyl transferase family protein n=1 Tax=Streptomyces sp. RerS4 TaxID=2942449 RepID=UPI00201C25AA|nr:4'-phosphopantetheinyl transferase superfamily protein [Streptomyces sp. RerS4]UQX05471.1 4'-phosphopantetheinyl transferase superfamily protein [Streptomyces sp. RerS4]
MTVVAAHRRPAVRVDGLERADFTLAGHRVDVWLIRCPVGAAAEALARDELDEAERQRAAAFLQPSGGLLYAAAHVALRRLIGWYTRTSPQELRFTREPCPGCGEPHGRPAVVSPRVALHFSLSHSAGVAMVAVAGVPVGVDVERLPGAETIEVCSRALHPDERSELASVAEGEVRRELFGRIWTHKEAFLKGLGTGLSRSPAVDYLGVDVGRHPEGWTVLGIPCGPTHAAAIAVRGPAPDVVDVRWVPDRWLSAGGGP